MGSMKPEDDEDEKDGDMQDQAENTGGNTPKKGKKAGKSEQAGDEDEKEDGDKPDENTKDGDDEDSEDGEDDDVAVPPSPRSPKTAAAAKAEQSRLRSASFRHGSSGPLNPSADGETTAADIYRKQAARIEELEHQNKRLGKDATDAEKRWQKAEEALADVRDGSNADSSGEVAKLVGPTACSCGGAGVLAGSRC